MWITREHELRAKGEIVGLLGMRLKRSQLLFEFRLANDFAESLIRRGRRALRSPCDCSREFLGTPLWPAAYRTHPPEIFKGEVAFFKPPSRDAKGRALPPVLAFPQTPFLAPWAHGNQSGQFPPGPCPSPPGRWKQRVPCDQQGEAIWRLWRFDAAFSE